MQEGTTTAPSATEPDAFLAHEHIAGLLERLRREPALRAWVLTAPTGALATLGVWMVVPLLIGTWRLLRRDVA